MDAHVFDLPESWTTSYLHVALDADDDRVRIHAGSGTASLMVRATAEDAHQIARALFAASLELLERED